MFKKLCAKWDPNQSYEGDTLVSHIYLTLSLRHIRSDFYEQQQFKKF